MLKKMLVNNKYTFQTYRSVTSKQVKHTGHIKDLKEESKAELQPLQGKVNLLVLFSLRL